MTKVLVLGSNGLVGQNLIETLTQFENKFEVVAVSKSSQNHSVTDNYYAIDCLEFTVLSDFIKEQSPHCIINLIALSQVDQCEEKPQDCYAINAEFPSQLAQLCKSEAIKLIHLSTDFVFDGAVGMYSETDVPAPVSTYGKAKVIGEQNVISILPNAAIIRTVLVYGRAKLFHRTNILSFVIDQLIENRPIKMAQDQYRTPTYVVDLCEAIINCIDREVVGILHISGKEYMNVYQFAVFIADAFELNSKLISPIETTQICHAGLRPMKTGFDISRAKNTIDYSPKSVSEALIELKVKLNLGS